MSSGIAVSDILQIDLHRRRGFCSVTVSSVAVRDRVLSQGISVAGERLYPGVHQPTRFSANSAPTTLDQFYNTFDPLNMATVRVQ